MLLFDSTSHAWYENATFGMNVPAQRTPIAIDLTGDGLTEYLVMTGTTPVEWTVFFPEANGGMMNAQVTNLGIGNPRQVFAIDWDRDGRQDLVYLMPGFAWPEPWRVARSLGDGMFAAPVNLQIGSTPVTAF